MIDIKYLAVYLPYGVNYKVTQVDDVEVMYTLKILDADVNHFQSKLLLKPMSEIDDHQIGLLNVIKDITGNPRPVWAMVKDMILERPIMYGNYYDRWPHGIFQFLIQNHYDVFGLIDQDLAIPLPKNEEEE